MKTDFLKITEAFKELKRDCLKVEKWLLEVCKTVKKLIKDI